MTSSNIITNVLAVINAAPTAVLKVNASFRKITGRTIVKAIRNLLPASGCLSPPGYGVDTSIFLGRR